MTSMSKITSLKFWFPVFCLVVIFISYIESGNPVQFYQTISEPVKYLLYVFASMIGLLSGYKVFKKCDVTPSSESGIFGLKLLSLGVMVGAFFLLLFGIYWFMFAGLFMPTHMRISLAREITGVFFIVFSFVLIVLSGYLLLKFQRRAGIIVYRR